MFMADDEQAMLDGAGGVAKQKAMELLVRYATALGAERFVNTTNIAGVPGSSTLFLHQYFKEHAGDGGFEAVFSFYDLDAGEILPVPRAVGNCCHLQGGMDLAHWAELGMTREAMLHQRDDEAELARHGVQIMKTCTPYLAGNLPVKGEHCAWMESSAVVYCNSVIGARTNTEGRESTSAAMLTNKIPDWGFHRDEYRRATHLIQVETPVESVMDWGMLGYFLGGELDEKIPVITGAIREADPLRHKHFGAAAASSGGTEMYHMVGLTPEAPDLEAALGSRIPLATLKYGSAERRRVYEILNSTAHDPHVDYIMLGCPHASIDQFRDVARLLAGKKIKTHLWMFTSRAVKSVADISGYTKIIENAGGVVMTDTCSSIARAVPKGTRVAAVDSAKQVHYLPAMTGVEAWFGTTEDCINAALTGRWRGELK
jgi:predicted aconitase